MIREHCFEARDAMADALSVRIAGLLQEALGERSRASLLVSGGRSPEPLYRRLSAQALPWHRVDVALVDERWVPESDSRSNAHMVRQSLLQGPASAATFRGMYSGDDSAEQALPAVERSYRALYKPFDLVLLGMGEDGHIASLFPHAAGLEPALDASGAALCAAIHARPTVVTGEITERMTVTLAALMQSRQLFLCIQGEAKLACLRAAMASPGDPVAIPVNALLHQRRVPVSVFWAP